MEQKLTEKQIQHLESKIPKQVEILRNFATEKHKLEIPNNCDKFLARCLRQKDGNIEKAASLIKAYYTCLCDLQSWNVDIQPSVHAKFYNKLAITPLVKPDPKTGCRVFICRISFWDPKEIGFEDALVCLWMATQYIGAKFQDIQHRGYITVWDFTNFSISHLWAVNQWKLLAMGKYLQNGVAGRLKALHAIHHPRAVGLIYKAIKPFLKEKLRKRVILHDNKEQLLEQVSEDILPTYLHGTQDPESCEDKEIILEILGQDDFFNDMMKVRYPNY